MQSTRKVKKPSLIVYNIGGLDDKIHQGIDGIYYNSKGKPPYIIGEAKFNTAQLGNTLDGKQMSTTWILGSKSLQNAIDIEYEHYKNIINAVISGSQITKIGKKKTLASNVEYADENGCRYKTDSDGKISDVEASLELGDGKRNPYAQQTVGGVDRLPSCSKSCN